MTDFRVAGAVTLDTSGLDSAINGIGGSFKKMAGFAATAFAIKGVADFTRQSAEAAREQERLNRITEQLVATTGGAANVTAAHVAKLADKLSALTATEDEVIQANANLLLSFKGVQNQVGEGNNIFDRAVASALDLATVMGTDSKSATQQLAKALEDPQKGLTALTRSGVTFTKEEKEKIKALAESGQKLEAQRIIMAAVEGQSKGAAAAAADPWQRFDIVVGNLKETFGMELLPVITTVAGWLADVLPGALETLIGGARRFGAAFGALFGDDGPSAFGEMMDAALGNSGQWGSTFRVLGEGIIGFRDVVKDAVSVVRDLIEGDLASAAVTVGGLFGWAEDSEQVDVMIRAFERVRAVFQTVAGFVSANLRPLLIGLGVVIAALVAPLALAVGAVVFAYREFETFRNVVNAVIRFVSKQFGTFVAFVQEIWPQVQEAITHVMNVVADVVGATIALVVKGWEVFGDDILRIAQGAFKIVAAVITTTVNTIANVIRLTLAIINGDWSKAWNAVKDIVRGVWDGIGGIVRGALGILTGILGGWYDGLKRTARAAFQGILDAVQNVFTDLWYAGRNLVRGLWDGILSMAKWLRDRLEDFIGDNIVGWAKKVLGIASPSKAFARLGAEVPAGFAAGIAQESKQVRAAVGDMLDVAALRSGSDFALDARMAAAGMNRPAEGPTEITVNIHGVRDADDVRAAIPELVTALRAGVGKR